MGHVRTKVQCGEYSTRTSPPCPLARWERGSHSPPFLGEEMGGEVCHYPAATATTPASVPTKMRPYASVGVAKRDVAPT
jgi:hypothetical protein